MARSIIKKLNLDFLTQITNIGEASYTDAIECFFFNKKLLEKTIKEELKNYKSSTPPEWLTTDYININTLRELATHDTHKGEAFPIRTISENCFASMWRGLGGYRDRYQEVCDQLIFACKFTHHNTISVSSHAVRRWVELCLENRMLPKELDFQKAVNEGLFNINLLDHPEALLYIYLSNARIIQEEPAIVAFAIHLIDTLDCDFFLAYIMAENFCRKGPLHSYLTIQSVMASKQKIEDRKIGSIIQAKKLYTFINKLEEGKNKKKNPPTSNPKVANSVYYQEVKDANHYEGKEIPVKKLKFDEVGKWIRDIE